LKVLVNNKMTTIRTLLSPLSAHEQDHVPISKNRRTKTQEAKSIAEMVLNTSSYSGDNH